MQRILEELNKVAGVKGSMVVTKDGVVHCVNLVDCETMAKGERYSVSIDPGGYT